MALTKTYLVTNTLETRFPAEFVRSRNKKWIVLQHCRCVYKNLDWNEYLTGDIRVHCDFIERNHDLDYFACFGNTQLTKYKKWEVVSPKPSFKVWFSDMDGNPIMVNTKAEEEVAKRKKEMLKLYEDEMSKIVWPTTDDTTAQTPTTQTEEAKPYISAFTLELMLIY
jgi:hypothetical protein